MNLKRLLQIVTPLTALFVAFLSSASQGICADGPAHVLVLRVDVRQQPVVVRIASLDAAKDESGPGFVIWVDERGHDQWRSLPLSGATQVATERSHSPRFGMVSRSGGQGVVAGAPAMTVQLDQLVAHELVRSRQTRLITPAHLSQHLNPKVTFRRRPNAKDPQLPPEKFRVILGRSDLLNVEFAEGQMSVRWDDIPNLPKRFKEGLPNGSYSISGHSTASEFYVASAETQHKVFKPVLGLRGLLPRKNPVLVQVEVQTLLNQFGEDGSSFSYLGDACDLLEQIPENELTPKLTSLLKDIRTQLDGSSELKNANSDDSTGITTIDRARAAIASANWHLATKLLDSPSLAADHRAIALRDLYRAVILAESGLTTASQAEELFLATIKKLEHGDRKDLFRAHINYANFRFGRTQDRLNNHAFQIASGVTAPLTNALIDWSTALDHYRTALQLAEVIDPQSRNSIQINLAQLYALLADLIRTLDVPSNGQRQFEIGESAAAHRSQDFATSAVSGQDADLTTQAVGHEVLAHLAFRRRDSAEVQKRAELALALYTKAGALAGVEATHRTLGLLNLRQNEFAAESRLSQSDSEAKALYHLLLSHHLAEWMRLQFQGEMGLARSGFFARRAYVNEKLIELLVRQERYAEALHFVELSKARSLQDTLYTGTIRTVATHSNSTTDQLLANWPNDVAALEFFLGSSNSFGFLIAPSGAVSAWQIKDPNGKAIESQSLVARISQILQSMNGYAARQHADLLARRGIDHSWQNLLCDLSQELLPSSALAVLRKAKTVVIVPHHILHYLPFSALITEKDPIERTKFEFPQPRFLLDETFDICLSPSLWTWHALRTEAESEFRQVNLIAISNFSNTQPFGMKFDPLDGVKHDMANLREVFSGLMGHELTDDGAKETQVKDILQRPGMLFIGSHGHNVPANSLQSFIVCQPDNHNDGALTASEVFASEVHAALIVMSACYTGLSDQSPMPGDDLFGLQRAFLTSGSSSVVSGTWDVYDKTGPILMRLLFENLRAGEPVAAALSHAQRSFLKEQRSKGPRSAYSHPYFWAVYNVTGSDLVKYEK